MKKTLIKLSATLSVFAMASIASADCKTITGNQQLVLRAYEDGQKTMHCTDGYPVLYDAWYTGSNLVECRMREGRGSATLDCYNPENSTKRLTMSIRCCER